jgi:hypothetical protein
MANATLARAMSAWSRNAAEQRRVHVPRRSLASDYQIGKKIRRRRIASVSRNTKMLNSHRVIRLNSLSVS